MNNKEIIQNLSFLTKYCKAEYNDIRVDKVMLGALELIKAQQAEIEICAETIKRQDKEIERLKRENKILSKNADTAFQDGLNEAQDLYAKQVKNEVRAEAIKEFADSFDDELAKLRDTYFERGLKDYSLVCEVIHDYLYRTLKEMVGAIE